MEMFILKPFHLDQDRQSFPSIASCFLYRSLTLSDSQKYKKWYGFCKLMKIGAKTHIITSCGRREYLKIVVRVDDLFLVQLVV